MRDSAKKYKVILRAGFLPAFFVSKIRGPVHLRGDPIFWTGVAVGLKERKKREEKGGEKEREGEGKKAEERKGTKREEETKGIRKRKRKKGKRKKPPPGLFFMGRTQFFSFSPFFILIFYAKKPNLPLPRKSPPNAALRPGDTLVRGDPQSNMRVNLKNFL